MLDETERLKAEEQGQPLPTQSPQDNWAWVETETYDSIFVDSLKEAESDIMVISREEAERGRQSRPSQQGEWGWERLALMIAGLIGFSIFTGASIMAILATYWWLIFIVWAWRNQNFKLRSWPSFIIGIFSWIILTSGYNGFGLPPLFALGIISAGATLVHWLNLRRSS